MHFQFLIEDNSGKILVDKVMQKLSGEGMQFSYDSKAFKGIGGYGKKKSVKDVKTNKLLTDLVIYLKGFDKSLNGISACIVVVVDNDKRNTECFEQELLQCAEDANISIECLFCVAVEEMEAWLLGDEKALFLAYPNARESKYREYVQDSICGTWEVLADVVFKGGLKTFLKVCPTYREIGIYKAEWAEKIGEHFDLNANKSASFQKFLSAVRGRLKTT